MKIGYVRVSTKEQNEARQIESLKAEGVEKIYMDKQSGKDFARPEYQRMIADLKKGDVVIIHSLDRLGRNYDLIREEWKRITDVADIKVLDMPLLDTSESGNDLTGRFIADMVLQILAYVAENERNAIRKRQAEGIEIAKKEGKYKGRKPMSVDKTLFACLNDLYRRGALSKSEFAKKMGVSRPTLDKYCAEWA